MQIPDSISGRDQWLRLGRMRIFYPGNPRASKARGTQVSFEEEGTRRCRGKRGERERAGN